jgi:hypothetical protein
MVLSVRFMSLCNANDVGWLISNHMCGSGLKLFEETVPEGTLKRDWGSKENPLPVLLASLGSVQPPTYWSTERSFRWNSNSRSIVTQIPIIKILHSHGYVKLEPKFIFIQLLQKVKAVLINFESDVDRLVLRERSQIQITRTFSHLYAVGFYYCTAIIERTKKKKNLRSGCMWTLVKFTKNGS